jgi:hypothetical protein
MMPTRRLFSLGLLGLAALPSGCASPNPDLLTLDAVPGAVRSGGPHTVLLQDIAVAPYLDRKAIVRSSEGYHIEVATNDWWGEPFTAMLGRVLSAEIEQRLPATTVFTEASAVDARPNATVAINITRFDEAVNGSVVLVAQIGVSFARKSRATVTDGLRYVVPVTDKGVTAQAAAMSVALGQLADRVAEALAG